MPRKTQRTTLMAPYLIRNGLDDTILSYLTNKPFDLVKFEEMRRCLSILMHTCYSARQATIDAILNAKKKLVLVSYELNAFSKGRVGVSDVTITDSKEKKWGVHVFIEVCVS